MKTHDSSLRLRQLDRLLKWEGILSNVLIREVLGLSAIRVSECIREFREKYPTWLQLDTKAKAYFPTHDFYRDLKARTNQYEDDATSLAGYLEMIGMDENRPTRVENRVVWSSHRVLGTPNPKTYSLMVRAAREEKVVTLMYHSMKHPEPHVRTLSPHSIVQAGRRWHVRAYCREVEDFRDFALGRITQATLFENESQDKGAADDADWNTIVKIRLEPHPKLSQAQAEVICLESFNGTSGLVESCRAALLSYFVQDIRAAVDVDHHRPPEFQIAVENIKEVRRWLFPT